MRFWFRAAVAWTIFILVICWMPRFAVAQVSKESRLFELPNFDKIVHVTLFMGFAYLWMKASIGPKRFRYVFLGGLAFSVISELGQLVSFVNREARLDDGLFNMVGVLLGYGVYEYLARREFHTVPLSGSTNDSEIRAK